MRFFLDTNVALDLILEREPFAIDAVQLFALSESDRIELLLSTDAISTIFYVVSKNKNKVVARQAISTLLDYVELAALNERDVINGLLLEFEDIEDALVTAVADRCDVRAIITRNIKDFKQSPVPVLTPPEALAVLSQI